MTDSESKWSELTLLPEWEEEFCLVYRVKKYGKWVMLKCLKPEYKEKPEFRVMLEKEFDVRYNLAHPNIVMINDFEPIPGLGMCIITDNVYGKSLRELIDARAIDADLLLKIKTQLPDALAYIQENHIVHRPLRPEMIMITEEGRNIKLIDVGFDQQTRLSHQETNTDLVSYGRVMQEVLRRTGRHDPVMNRVAARAAAGGFADVQAMEMAIAGRSARGFYIAATAFLAALLAVVLYLTFSGSLPK